MERRKILRWFIILACLMDTRFSSNNNLMHCSNSVVGVYLKTIELDCIYFLLTIESGSGLHV